MMQSRSWIFCCVLALACGQADMQPATETATEEAAHEEHDMESIAAAIDDVWRRYGETRVAGDHEAFTQLHTPDAQVFLSGAPALNGHDEIRAFVTRTSEGLRPVDVKIQREELDATEDTAWELGTFTESWVDAAGDTITRQGRYMAVLKANADGTWQLHRLMTQVADQNTGP